MLSIGKLTQGQHRYYERQVAAGQDDYYSGRGESPGEWRGRGAAELGLSGKVSSVEFNALIAGNNPKSPAERLRSTPEDPRIAAIDLTFSAPKSVSVLFATAPEQLSGTLVACHEQAVHAALDYLQDTATQVRRGHAGERVEPAQGLIAAAYRHRMSRALDPQLHTHVVAANLAKGADGRFTALHGTVLYRSAKTAGCLYQAHLRALISDRLGLEWEDPHNGMAELAGIDKQVLEHFSKRRNDMLAAALDGGIPLDSKAAAQSAAIATRNRKQYGIDTHTWREEVRARAAELGLGAREIQALLAQGRERLERGETRAATDEETLADYLASDGGLTERENTFDLRPVLQAMASAAKDGALVGEVRAQAARFTRRPDILETSHCEYTTTGLVECEQALIDAATDRAKSRVAALGPPRIDRALEIAPHTLTSEQEQVVRAVVSSGDGVSVIEALAGTGKTYTAGAIRDVYEHNGYRVLGVAPTGRAARELTEQAGIAARTIDQLLIDIEQLGERLPSRCVLILDEAGMAATRLTARLLAHAKDANAKVIAIGDPGQLVSVQAGGWLSALGKRLGASRLTEVVRQRDKQERQVLAALHERDPKPYLAWAQAKGMIETFKTAGDARDQTLHAWTRAVARYGMVDAAMIARENETREALNRMARETMREQGALGDQRTYGDVTVAIGDRVICRRNDKRLDVDNGMRATIVRVEEDRVVMEADGGALRELPARYLEEHLEHAYALTGHGMQGATLETAIVLATPHDLTAGWSYTALSRARGQTRLLIHDDDYARAHDPTHAHPSARADFAPEDRVSKLTRDDLLSRVARRMIERDDEDLAIERLPAHRSQARSVASLSLAR